MGLIAWLTDGEPIYCKVNPSFPRADGSTNDVTNRPLREVLSYSGVNPDADFVGFPQLFRGSGSPEGVITSPVGHLYFQDNGAAGAKLWYKGTGVGNTGWEQSTGGGGGAMTVAQMRAATPILELYDTHSGVIGAVGKIQRFGGDFKQEHGTFFAALNDFYNASTASGTATGILQMNSNGVVTRRMIVNLALEQYGFSSIYFGMPLAQRFATAPIISRTYRKYTYELSFKLSGAIPANNAFELGLHDRGGEFYTTTFIRGIMVSARNGVNSGNIVVLHRLTDGGALTTTNTALDPTVSHKMQIVYTEGATPTIVVSIDGSVVLTLSGEANMPTATAEQADSGARYSVFGPAILNRANAGGSAITLDTWDAHYLVEEL